MDDSCPVLEMFSPSGPCLLREQPTGGGPSDMVGAFISALAVFLFNGLARMVRAEGHGARLLFLLVFYNGRMVERRRFYLVVFFNGAMVARRNF